MILLHVGRLRKTHGKTPGNGSCGGGGGSRTELGVGADKYDSSLELSDTPPFPLNDPGYMSRKIRKFRTDKFDT